MMCSSGGKCGKLCPVSFGMAVGITSALATFISFMWMVKHGVPAMLGQFLPPTTVIDILIESSWALLKGFVFGFFVAFIYDLIRCCLQSMCCKQSNQTACGSDTAK